MPGLVDTRLGDEERMIKTLGEDADFILLVRRPMTADDLMDVDTNLSDAAHKALKDRLPFNLWSFMVLNYDGQNLDMCNYFKEHKLRHSLNVAEFIIVNCKDAEGADDKHGVLTVNELLGRVLKYLLDNIEVLDATYIGSFDGSFDERHKDILYHLEIVTSVVHKYCSLHPQYAEVNRCIMRVRECVYDLEWGQVTLAKELGKMAANSETSNAEEHEAPVRVCRKNVFISYSHCDLAYLNRLEVHLRPLEREGIITRWDDRLIKPGSHWRDEIREAIRVAKVAVLLVSADFLASDFIAKNELPPLLEAAEAEGATVLPVILKPCLFSKMETLSRFQAVNSPSRPLVNMPPGQREWLWVKVTEAIELALQA